MVKRLSKIYYNPAERKERLTSTETERESSHTSQNWYTDASYFLNCLWTLGLIIRFLLVNSLIHQINLENNKLTQKKQNNIGSTVSFIHTLPQADWGLLSWSMVGPSFTVSSASARPQVQFLQAFLVFPTSQSPSTYQYLQIRVNRSNKRNLS